MVRSSYVVVGVLVVVALVMVGCKGTAASRVEVNAVEDTMQVQPGDVFIDGKLRVEDVKTKIEGGILSWQVVFKNTRTYTINAEYRVKYFDATGWELTTGMTAWKPLILVGLETVNVQGSCPVPGATKFTFYFRETRPIGR